MTQPWTFSTSSSQAFERVDGEWYVEPVWCSERLFEEEKFEGGVYDPCCGMGRIPLSALKIGLRAYGSDKVHRGWDSTPQDFFRHRDWHDNLVFNPPFDIAKEFARHALALARRKVAMIFPTARLNAAHWMLEAPLARIWLMTPRPSMPPGNMILAGEKPGGGKSDYCWVVWSRDYTGAPEMCWLHRERAV